MEEASPTSTASLRWAIIRRALRPSSSSSCDGALQKEIERVSRKSNHGFNVVPWELSNSKEESVFSTNGKDTSGNRDAVVCYRLPIGRTPALHLTQRLGYHVELHDFEISNIHNIDSTGRVCMWPSEEVLTYYCLTHADTFSSKIILELGSGYGLAGLAVAASTDANEVIISDGNPQVIDYIQHNINANSNAFGGTTVKPLQLHWGHEQTTDLSNHFDIIIASDWYFPLLWTTHMNMENTFFKEFHADLAYTVRHLLRNSENSLGIFFSPRRGNTLDMFLNEARKLGLKAQVIENYDTKVFGVHQKLLNGEDSSWPGYVADHCYPLMIKITF